MTQCPNFDYSEDLEDLEQDGCERAASLAAVQESGGRARRTVRRQQRKSKARGLHSEQQGCADPYPEAVFAAIDLMFDACSEEHPDDDDAFDQCICKPGGVHDSEAKAYADLMTQCPNFDYSEDLEDLEQDGCERAASLAAVQKSGGRARRNARRQQRKSKARGLQSEQQGCADPYPEAVFAAIEDMFDACDEEHPYDDDAYD